MTSPNSTDSTQARLAYIAELVTNFETGTIEYADPRAYTAKFKTPNTDNPSYHMEMSCEHDHEWEKAMIIEVKNILKKKTWVSVIRNTVPENKPILPGIWAFKLKRLLDGSSLKYKVRYCVRGDKQVAGVN